MAPPNPPSRGKLLKEYLSSPISSIQTSGVEPYLTQHEGSADKYEGFNLLLFDVHTKGQAEVGYLSNRPQTTRIDLSPDFTGPSADNGLMEIHGLSNTPLKDPFVKVTKGRQRMADELQEWAERQENEPQLIEKMMDLLS